MPEFVYRNGQRLTPWMAYCVDLLDRDLRRLFGVGCIVTSGIRTNQEQVDIFTRRYTRTPNGRRVYDTRWWNGALWYRIDKAGTVAQPGTSNHEIQGDDAAMDLADTGGPGIGTMGSERSNWLRANAWRYGLIPEGFNFREAWHYKVPNIYQTPPGAPAGGGTSKPLEGDNMQSISINGNLYGVDVEFITHYGTVAQANVTRAVTSPTDELHDLNKSYGKQADYYWGELLDGLGIPRDVLDAKGLVKNPQSGRFEGNGTWSRQREILADMARLFSAVAALKPAAK